MEKVPPSLITRLCALGLGSFAVQMAVANYNAYLPLLYGRHVESNALIGLIMIVDNIFAVTILPYFAGLSDRIDTRLGRRIPFLLVGVPAAAVSLALIPRMPGLPSLLISTLMMNAAASVFISPMAALMPDITPQPLRGRASGIINFMGGLGALVAYFVMSHLYSARPNLPFDITAIVLVLVLVGVIVTINERRFSFLYQPAASAAGAAVRTTNPHHAHEPSRLLSAARDLLRRGDRSVFFLLLLGFTAVAAVNGVQNMFTRYGVHHLGLEPSAATFMLGFFVLPFMAFAIPAGVIGDRFGRLRTMRLGLAGTLAAFALAAVVRDPGAFKAVLLLGGLFWPLLITNAYPLLANLTPPREAGLYAGLWVAAFSAGGLISPPIYGWFVDLWGFEAFFVPGIAFMVVALVLSFRVRQSCDTRGAPVPAV